MSCPVTTCGASELLGDPFPEIGPPFRIRALGLVGLVHYIRRSVADGFGLLAPLAGRIEPTTAMDQVGARADARTHALVARVHDDGALRTDVTTMDLSLLIDQFSRLPAPPDQGSPPARPSAGHRH
ncbi:hypothetical protein [Sciscionella marina]|uniref:hypothetical protein n=1 Tax=Sciscionella marina TaxID=508770 RepID=UPI001F0894D8|nr:hypothetical protein [Sciscionella marina]